MERRYRATATQSWKIEAADSCRRSFTSHRTVKPLAICEYIIKLTTFSKNAIVLDPFVGSGTTVIAAKNLNRKFIGIDVNKEYVEIALKRLENIEKEEVIQYDTNNKKGQLMLFETREKYGTRKKRFKGLDNKNAQQRITSRSRVRLSVSPNLTMSKA